MLLQEAGIPDNVPYLILGLVMLFLFLGGWLASYFWRLRSLRRDIVMLEQLAEEDAAAAPASAEERDPAEARHAQLT
ncbi:MAG: hypothetical protein JW910_13405 [Anaerolineae bacterium]|nr:hypothetical protein [Anaerolineae bacterium]